MELIIRNFRGIEKAEIELNSISIIAGQNAAGKTSVAQALAGALTGEPNPIKNLSKKDLSQLLRGGGVCEVKLSDDEGSTSITYPAAQVATEGNPASATPAACGRINIATLEPKARAEYLADLLETAPTKDDLLQACEALDLPRKHAEALWEKIVQEGWDGAHAHAKETGARFKGQWEEITSDRYGSNKADKWLPDNWESDLEGLSEEILAALVTDARDHAEAVLKSEAVSEEKMESLKRGAVLVPMLREKLDVANGKHHALGEKMVAALAAKEAIPKPGVPQKTTPCPYCEQPVVIAGELLAVPKEIVADDGTALEETKKLTVEIARITKAQDELGIRKIQDDLAIAERDAEQLEKLTEEEPRESESFEVINKSREDKQLAENRLAAFQRKTRADRIHSSIGLNASVIAMLSPDGLKKKALSAKLTAFNALLEKYATTAGWAACIIESDLSVWYGIRPYALCSMSEQYRAWVQLVVAAATMDGSDAVVIDGADILGRDGRNGLLFLLDSLEIPSMICMTLVSVANGPTDQEQAVSLSKALSENKWGALWWLEGGIAERLSA